MKPEFPPLAGAHDAFDRDQRILLQRGWTDGLPIVPPTEERVSAMLAGMPRATPMR
jgi:hypothetical protein